MSEQENGSQTPRYAFLLIALLLALAFTYVAFVVLPAKWTDHPQEYGDTLHPSERFYRDQGAEAETTESVSPVDIGYIPLKWRGLIRAENINRATPDITVTISDLDDDPLTVDEFHAEIVWASDNTRKHPADFREEKPGLYTLRNFVPPSGEEWEIRATLRRGLDTLIISENLRMLTNP